MKQTLKTLAVFIFLIFLLILTGGSVGKSVKPPSGVIFPHKYHIEDVGLECSVCHSNATSSISGMDKLLPSKPICAECHDVDDKSTCKMCHVNPDKFIPRPGSRIEYVAFSHKTHTAKQACKDCHPVEAGVAEIGKSIPIMRDCYDCHNIVKVNLTCGACHTKGMPSKPSDHRIDWAKSHGPAALFEGENCAMCHQLQSRDDCAACHQSGGYGSPHPRKFVHSKAFTRGGGYTDCQICHEPESFCVSCHIQKMVLPSDHSRPGWANTRDGGTHARKATIDFDSCVICHTSSVKEPSCFAAGCHK